MLIMRMHHKQLVVLGLVAALGVLGFVTHDVPRSGAPLPRPDGSAPVATVGLIAPLTGDASTYGRSIKRGVDLAAHDLGLAGLRVVYMNTECDGPTAAAAVDTLVHRDHAIAIIGEVCSGATVAAATRAAADKVVLVSPSATSPDLDGAGPYFFRTVPSDLHQAAFAAKLLYDNGYRKLGIIASKGAYGDGFSIALSSDFTALGGIVTAHETFERGATDLRQQLSDIKGSGADAMYIVSNSPSSSAALLRQAQTMRPSLGMIGSDGLADAATMDAAGNAADGLVVTTVTGGTPAFERAHMHAYGSEPGPFAAQAYDAFTAVAKAIQQGARTGDQVRRALERTDFPGVSGTIRFDVNGDVDGTYQALVVKQGKLSPYAAGK